MEIARLAEHPEAIPLLARWFMAEWRGYYVDRDAEDDFRRSSQDVFVAFEGKEAIGTVALRPRALDGFADLSPGLGGLYVAPPHRRRGVGSALVRAAAAAAGTDLYTATAHAGALFERLGWQALPPVTQGGDILSVYRWNVARCGGTNA